jgi:hypothetical protein
MVSTFKAILRRASHVLSNTESVNTERKIEADSCHVASS